MFLKVEGTIVAPDGPSVWPKSMSKRQWLVFYRVNGMSLQGGGVIDGRGGKWWDLPCKPHKVWIFFFTSYILYTPYYKIRLSLTIIILS